MYTEIFHEITDILHHDYAGCIDKKGWDHPDPFLKKIQGLEEKNQLTSNHFQEIVRDYIMDFQDPHIHFNLIESETHQEQDNGFRTRRYDDKLYVTSQTTEIRLNIGDAIISLDGIPVLSLVNKHQRELMETKAEREDWRDIIFTYDTAEVMDPSGNMRTLELRKHEKAKYQPEHSLKRVDDDTFCMKLTDFDDAEPIDRLIEENKDAFNTMENLILDVRLNLGGSTLAYKNLEKYLFPEGSTTIDFSFYDMTVNCSERNATLMIQAIDNMLEKMDNEQFRKGLKHWKEQTWVKHRGKGFISFDEEESDSRFEIKGHQHPKHIILLTDNLCGSAGDMFVYFCKQSPKVTVVGRPTMGINDYSNLNVKKWNNQFKLLFPTSRLTQLDNRNPDYEQGIKPDVYIPWTPEHLEKDIDMDAALKMLAETKPD